MIDAMNQERLSHDCQLASLQRLASKLPGSNSFLKKFNFSACNLEFRFFNRLLQTCVEMQMFF